MANKKEIQKIKDNGIEIELNAGVSIYVQKNKDGDMLICDDFNSVIVIPAENVTEFQKAVNQ